MLAVVLFLLKLPSYFQFKLFSIFSSQEILPPIDIIKNHILASFIITKIIIIIIIAIRIINIIIIHAVEEVIVAMEKNWFCSKMNISWKVVVFFG